MTGSPGLPGPPGPPSGVPPAEADEIIRIGLPGSPPRSRRPGEDREPGSDQARDQAQHQATTVAEAHPAGHVPPAPPIVELRGIAIVGPPGSRRVRHGGQHRRDQPSVLVVPDVTVRRGELVTLVGPPGSGKTSLLGVIGLIERPATGSYLLNGIEAGRLRDRDRAAMRGREVGSQFQQPQLLPLRSVLENVALPLRYSGIPRRRHRAAALAALGVVGLADHAQVRAGRLSAAHQRLVAIARALVADPGLLLFDDPTASLDAATAAQVASLLVSLCRDGKTVIVATDDQLAAAHSSQRFRLAGPPHARLPLTRQPTTWRAPSSQAQPSQPHSSPPGSGWFSASGEADEDPGRRAGARPAKAVATGR